MKKWMRGISKVLVISMVLGCLRSGQILAVDYGEKAELNQKLTVTERPAMALSQNDVVPELWEKPYTTVEPACTPVVSTGEAIDSEMTPVPTSQAGIKVSFSKSVVKLYPGKSTKNKLKVKGKYDKVKWSVSNTKYAKVSSTGKVTLKKAGAGKNLKVKAVVIYTADGKTCRKEASYTLKGLRPVKSIKVKAKKNYVFVGKKLSLTAKCSPASAYNRKVKWSSSNKKYATITAKGVVKPKKAGAGKTVTFTAKSKDGFGAKAKIKVRIIDLKKPMVALTFDDGPSYSYTSRIVNKLKAYDARATFFVLGSKLGDARTKKLVKNSAAYGNEIASHTYNHKNLATLSAGDIGWESANTIKRIKSVTGKEVLLTRPPYGSYNARVKSCIHTPLIMWSIDTRDWQTRNTSKTVQSVMNNVKDGDIVLMHDIYDATASAAEQIIPALVKKGYQLVTVSELATYKKVKLESGNAYGSIR